MSIASAKDEIRRRRKLVPFFGIDPLRGPWRILSTDGSYAHEIHVDPAGLVTCSTCLARHGRRLCWATARVLDSLGQANQAQPEPEPGSWRAAFDEHQNHHHPNGAERQEEHRD